MAVSTTLPAPSGGHPLDEVDRPLLTYVDGATGDIEGSRLHVGSVDDDRPHGNSRHRPCLPRIQ